MAESRDGFLYPEVDPTACTECGLCEKVCPALNDSINHCGQVEAYAARSTDESIKSSSSSGGIFSELCRKVINKDRGIVFGACFAEDWSVVHDCAEDFDRAKRFKGSKYVQSDINGCFKQAEHYLKEGRFVLFSGTPCQIKGLKLFLAKDYENLFTMDVVCHGVPSPLVWRQYLSEFNEEISGVNFRDKTTGWKQFSLKISGKDGKTISRKSLDKDPFMYSFLKDLCLRPSCYDCPAKGGNRHSGSDITLGDFWGIQNVMPQMDDDKGTSLVIINTEHGKGLLKDTCIDYAEVSLESARKYNSAISKSVRGNEYVGTFWEKFHSRDYKTMASLAGSFRTPLYKRILMKLSKSIGLH